MSYHILTLSGFSDHHAATFIALLSQKPIKGTRGDTRAVSAQVSATTSTPKEMNGSASLSLGSLRICEFSVSFQLIIHILMATSRWSRFSRSPQPFSLGARQPHAKRPSSLVCVDIFSQPMNLSTLERHCILTCGGSAFRGCLVSVGSVCPFTGLLCDFRCPDGPDRSQIQTSTTDMRD